MEWKTEGIEKTDRRAVKDTKIRRREDIRKVVDREWAGGREGGK
jgi:hypothetical protein